MVFARLSHGRRPAKPDESKYPQVKPGALCCEPLKAVNGVRYRGPLYKVRLRIGHHFCHLIDFKEIGKLRGLGLRTP
jgi:hypothetical protein